MNFKSKGKHNNINYLQIDKGKVTTLQGKSTKELSKQVKTFIIIC